MADHLLVAPVLHLTRSAVHVHMCYSSLLPQDSSLFKVLGMSALLTAV